MLELFDELIEMQRGKLLACASRIIPHITADDLLQPNDFPELERHPHFRYEEGVLEGLLTARMAFLAKKAGPNGQKDPWTKTDENGPKRTGPKDKEQ